MQLEAMRKELGAKDGLAIDYTYHFQVGIFIGLGYLIIRQKNRKLIYNFWFLRCDVLYNW
jgi:hypothetical protein